MDVSGLGLPWYFRSNRRQVNDRHPIAMYTLAQNARLQAETECATVACNILESKRDGRLLYVWEKDTQKMWRFTTY